MTRCCFCKKKIAEVGVDSVTMVPIDKRTGDLLVTHDSYEESTHSFYDVGRSPFAHVKCFDKAKEKALRRWREEETKRKKKEGCWICGSSDLHNPHGGVPFDFCNKCGRERGYIGDE